MNVFSSVTAPSPPLSAFGPFSGQALSCRRGGRPVLAGVSFAVVPGEALLLEGRNGVGKSTLLRVMAGLSPPTSGVLLWHDAPVADDREAHAARLHYLGHCDAVKPTLTALENIVYWVKQRHRSGKERTLNDGPVALAEAALFRLGLHPCRDRPGGALSAGMKRRLALARLIAVPAPLWLLDEPATALDRTSTDLLECLIAEHRRAGGIVVFSSHGGLPANETQKLSLDAFSPSRKDS